MILKELLKVKITESGISKKEIARLANISSSLLSAYLNGVNPSDKKLEALATILKFELSEIELDEDLNISAVEAAAMMKKSVLFVRNAVIRGKLPGTFEKSESGKRTNFQIPRLAFYRYMGIEPPLR